MTYGNLASKLAAFWEAVFYSWLSLLSRMSSVIQGSLELNLNRNSKYDPELGSEA